MKKRFLTLAFFVVSTICFAQNGYKKVGKYDEYNKDWALVKTISGTYGFVNRNGETVVEPIYDEIEKFTENSGKYALVKSVAGSYGFIDRNGKEVIPIIYWNKHDANEQLKSLKETENKDLEVLLVGTFHFRNFNPKNNGDVVQTNEVDVLSDQNQKELRLISDKISEFNPDKIFIEFPFENQNKLDSLFNSFAPKNYNILDRSENIQLAFRAAKQINHTKIFGYDYRIASFPYDEMLETMEKANQGDLIEIDDAQIKEYEAEYNKLVNSTKSVTEILYYLNDDKNRKADLGWYLNFANKAGSEKDSVGSFLASEWYRRNLVMYSNIQKQINTNDKKIMILSGASHIAVFKDFISYNPKWNTIELKEIMK